MSLPRRSCLLLLPLVVIAALPVPAAAQGTMYRCIDKGVTVFSDKPCPGDAQAMPLPEPGGPKAAAKSASPAVANPAARPATSAGAVRAPTPIQAAPARPGAGKAATGGLGYATREQRCAEGSRQACDEIACLQDDAEACARSGGIRGSGWYEASRRRETHRGTNDLGKTTLKRVLVLTITCTGPVKKSGDILLGRGSITLRNATAQFSSVDTAAAALCKR
jgi:hypothetical protein